MKLPVTVIGGYLGAGKTTLINSLLRHADGLRLAVLVNEFGALAIDEDLIEAEGDGLMSISGGCVCCAFGSDMIGVLEDIRDASPAFDHVLIEASGVALPASIMTTVGLVAGFRPDATVVLADAEQIRRNAKDRFLSDTVLRQLAQADILLLTKPDLVSPEGLQDVEAWLREQAPQARQLHAAHGDIPKEALLGAIPLPRRINADGTSHAAFASCVLAPAGPVDVKALARSLAAEGGITRAKGYLRGTDGLYLVHVVGPRQSVEKSGEDHPVGLVCIGPRDTFDEKRLHDMLAGAHLD